MHKQIIVCDHCGKEFNAVAGYEYLTLDDWHVSKSVDLCDECHEELCDIIKDFVKEK